ncbi:MAG TPA: hypothetical protein PKO33_15465, partial [Pyrinomonadaceae bacterium]|nr:hypothetical protein [Pyrinomonadaceae bacterium]
MSDEDESRTTVDGDAEDGLAAVIGCGRLPAVVAVIIFSFSSNKGGHAMAAFVALVGGRWSVVGGRWSVVGGR